METVGCRVPDIFSHIFISFLSFLTGCTSPSGGTQKSQECKKENSKQAKKWQICLPKNVVKRNLAIIVVAYYLSLFQEGSDPATWRMLTYMSSEDSAIQKDAISFLEQQMKPFEQLIPKSEQNGDLESIFSFINEQHISFVDFSGTFEFSCQIHVFHAKTGTLLTSYPEKYDPCKRQLFLSGILDSSNNFFDIMLIENITNFYKIFGVYCFFCKKFFRGRGTQHKCHKTMTCFPCRRPLLAQSTFVTPQTRQYFCDSSLQPTVSTLCKDCNMTIFTPHCMKHHKERVCRWGITCTKCNAYIYHSKFYPKQKILDSHVCGVRRCYFCGNVGEKGKHICNFCLPKFDNEFTNLGFLNFEYNTWTITNCAQCFELNKPCSKCNDMVEKKAIFCTTIIEAEKRGHFDEYNFSSSDFSLRQTKSYKYNYLAPSLGQKELSKRRKTNFGFTKKNVIKENIFSKKNMSVTEKFLNEVQNFPNTTFVIGFNSQMCFEELIKTFCSHGIIPKIVGQPRIFLVEVPPLDIRFISMENYGEILSSCNNNPKKYFPLAWLNTKDFSYNGEPPNEEDFFNFYDNDKEIQEKKDHAASLSFPWNFLENLIEYSKFKFLLLAEASLSFLKQSFLCQEKIALHLKESAKEFVHPFNPPLFTKAGYAFKLMCLFSPDLRDVKVVNPPIHMKSSKGELEYCFFKIWQNPTETFLHAWSPYGQKKFPESFPDLYMERDKKCFFWNGCLVHGHPESKCLFKRKSSKGRNMFGIESQVAYKEYTEKNEKLLRKQPIHVLEIEEMWHCKWQQLKKEDQEVKFFLKNIYRNPPLYRLQPRAAGKFVQ